MARMRCPDCQTEVVPAPSGRVCPQCGRCVSLSRRAIEEVAQRHRALEIVFSLVMALGVAGGSVALFIVGPAGGGRAVLIGLAVVAIGWAGLVVTHKRVRID